MDRHERIEKENKTVCIEMCENFGTMDIKEQEMRINNALYKKR